MTSGTLDEFDESDGWIMTNYTEIKCTQSDRRIEMLCTLMLSGETYIYSSNSSNSSNYIIRGRNRSLLPQTGCRTGFRGAEQTRPAERAA